MLHSWDVESRKGMPNNRNYVLFGTKLPAHMSTEYAEPTSTISIPPDLIGLSLLLCEYSISQIISFVRPFLLLFIPKHLLQETHFLTKQPLSHALQAIFFIFALADHTIPSPKHTFQVTFCSMANKLNRVFETNYDFRRSIFSMLTPLDIISCVVATGVRLSQMEKEEYLVSWKHLFLNMDWLDTLASNDCTATIIGTHSGRLDIAIDSWDYTLDTVKLKFLPVIVGMDKNGTGAHSRIGHIVQCFDTPTSSQEIRLWNPRICLLEIPDSPNNKHVCITSLPDQIRANLTASLGKARCSSPYASHYLD